MGVYVYIRCKNPKFVAKCWHFVTGSFICTRYNQKYLQSPKEMAFDAG